MKNKRIIAAVILFLAAIGVYILFDGKFTDNRSLWVTFFEMLLLGVAFSLVLPNRQIETSAKTEKKLKKGTIVGICASILLIPITMLFGVYYLGDRKYYFISLLVIIEMMLPFFLAFEGKKPSARELSLVGTLCALTVLGRCAFFMLPQFKPTLAMIIISGVAYGGGTGFLVGAVGAFVSNMFFGQGPWTPWQMFACGTVGLFAGLIFNNMKIRKTRLSLCIYGAVATVVVHGGILNPASVIMYQPQVTVDAIVSFCIAGLPFDLIHACSTVFFLWLISAPMLNKLERVKTKYGLFDRT